MPVTVLGTVNGLVLVIVCPLMFQSYVTPVCGVLMLIVPLSFWQMFKSLKSKLAFGTSMILTVVVACGDTHPLASVTVTVYV